MMKRTPEQRTRTRRASSGTLTRGTTAVVLGVGETLGDTLAGHGECTVAVVSR